MTGPSDCPPDDLEQQQEFDLFLSDLEAEVQNLMSAAKQLRSVQHTYHTQQVRMQLKVIQDTVEELIVAVNR
jgi:hypothetical protein